MATTTQTTPYPLNVMVHRSTVSIQTALPLSILDAAVALPPSPPLPTASRLFGLRELLHVYDTGCAKEIQPIIDASSL